jgi:hypothetical protein
MEQAAEECCQIFNRLDAADRRALHVRLLAIGALNAGDLDFIDKVAAEARQTVLDFITDKELEGDSLRTATASR